MKKYVELYNKIKNDIIDGSIECGKKLPSKRSAAELYKVSVITVETAYDVLQSEGYIESRERSGYFVCYSASELINAQPPLPEIPSPEIYDSDESYLKNRNVKNSEKNENFSFSAYAAAVRYTLNEQGELLTRKTDGCGAKELRHALKNYLKTSRNIITNEKNIIIGSGAEYLYGLILKILGNDKVYAIESPSYEKIEDVYKQNGIVPLKLKLGKYGILTEQLKKSNAQILHVTPYRSYPTGVTASASKKAEYLRYIAEKKGYIIEDDYESEFSLSANLTETLFGNSDKNVIYVNTFSKTIFPSIRTAYMILPDKLLKIYDELFKNSSCTVPALEQYVLAKIISDGSFGRHLNKVRRLRKKNKI